MTALESVSQRWVVGTLLTQSEFGVRINDFRQGWRAPSRSEIAAALDVLIAAGVVVETNSQTGTGGGTESFYSLAADIEIMVEKHHG